MNNTQQFNVKDKVIIRIDEQNIKGEIYEIYYDLGTAKVGYLEAETKAYKYIKFKLTELKPTRYSNYVLVKDLPDCKAKCVFKLSEDKLNYISIENMNKYSVCYPKEVVENNEEWFVDIDTLAEVKFGKDEAAEKTIRDDFAKTGNVPSFDNEKIQERINKLNRPDGLAIDTSKGTSEEAKILSMLWQKFKPTILQGDIFWNDTLVDEFVGKCITAVKCNADELTIEDFKKYVAERKIQYELNKQFMETGTLIYNKTVSECLKKDYEKLSYANPFGTNTIVQPYKIDENSHIYSVKRLSDGEIFTVGESIEFGSNGNHGMLKYNSMTIKGFEIEDSKLIAKLEFDGAKFDIEWLHKPSKK
jgi:hypothetical protein